MREGRGRALAHAVRLALSCALVFSLAAFLALQLVPESYEVAASGEPRADFDLASDPVPPAARTLLRRLAGEEIPADHVRIVQSEPSGQITILATAGTPEEARRLAEARARELAGPALVAQISPEQARLSAERSLLEERLTALGEELAEDHPRLSIMRMRLHDIDAELARLRDAAPEAVPEAEWRVSQARAVGPPVLLVTATAACAGLFLGLVAAFASAWARRRTGRAQEADHEAYPVSPAPVPAASERPTPETVSLDHLADALAHEPVSRLLLVSADGEGRTALALARRLSERGERVLLADLSPSQEVWREAGPRVESPGLAGLAAGLDLAALVRRDRESRAHLLPSGGGAGRAASAMSALDAARGSYDHILVDCGSMDARSIGGLADRETGVVLTTRATAADLCIFRLGELRRAGIEDVLVVECAA